MYAIAIFGDLVSIIPLFNIVSSPITALLLSMANTQKLDLFNNKGSSLTIATIVIETIPIMSIFPTWTLRVWWAMRKAKKEGRIR